MPRDLAKLEGVKEHPLRDGKRVARGRKLSCSRLTIPHLTPAPPRLILLMKDILSSKPVFN